MYHARLTIQKKSLCDIFNSPPSQALTMLFYARVDAEGWDLTDLTDLTGPPVPPNFDTKYKVRHWLFSSMSWALYLYFNAMKLRAVDSQNWT